MNVPHIIFGMYLKLFEIQNELDVLHFYLQSMVILRTILLDNMLDNRLYLKQWNVSLPKLQTKVCSDLVSNPLDEPTYNFKNHL